MLASLRRAAERGLPVYAECGGLMYLGRALRDPEGREHAMLGLAPFVTSLGAPKVTVGYREVQARSARPLLRRGETLPGHEFHWSVLHHVPQDSEAAYAVLDQTPVANVTNRERTARFTLAPSLGRKENT